MPLQQRRITVALAYVFAFSLASCNSGGGGGNGPLPSSPMQGPARLAPLAATPSPLPSTIILKQGATIGAAGAFTPKRGDTASGGAGQTVDGVPCLPTMVENQFHVHSFVGLLVNGQEEAIPDSIGINGYGPLINGFVNAGRCFYQIHTHDATGMIHQEAASSVGNGGSLFTVGNVLDIWGEPISGTGFGPFPGVVRVFVAKVALRTLIASGYTEYLGDPTQIKLYSHEAIWIEVGPTYVDAAHLPAIRFYTEY
jgi:hypothetical protein